MGSKKPSTPQVPCSLDHESLPEPLRTLQKPQGAAETAAVRATEKAICEHAQPERALAKLLFIANQEKGRVHVFTDRASHSQGGHCHVLRHTLLSTLDAWRSCSRQARLGLAIEADGLEVAVRRLDVRLDALKGGVSIGGDAAVGGLVVLVLLHLQMTNHLVRRLQQLRNSPHVSMQQSDRGCVQQAGMQ